MITLHIYLYTCIFKYPYITSTHTTLFVNAVSKYGGYHILCKPSSQMVTLQFCIWLKIPTTPDLCIMGH